MCAECEKYEELAPVRARAARTQCSYQWHAFDSMLIDLQHAGLTRLHLLRAPPEKAKTINQLVQAVLNQMLNSKKLSELLSQNVHPKLFPKWM
jgi:hypothetical protein